MGEKTSNDVSNFAILQEENENPATNAQNQPSNQSPKAAKIAAVIIAVILLVIIVSLVGLKGNKNEPKQAKLATEGNRDNLRQDNSNATNPNETTTEFDPFTATISSMSPNKTETTSEFDPFTATISSMSPRNVIRKYPRPIILQHVYPFFNHIIMSNVDGTVLDVEHSSHEVGANLDLWPYIHGRNQLFKFVDANTKEQYDFYIENDNSKLLIGVNEFYRIAQVPPEIRPIWKLRNAPTVEGLFTIQLGNFKNPAKCLGNVRSPVAGLMMRNSLELVNCDIGEQTYFRLIMNCMQENYVG